MIDDDDEGPGEGEEGSQPEYFLEDNFDLSVELLSRDLRIAAKTMGAQEARYLVDAYYIMQEDRKRAMNQQRALGAEPHIIISWLARQSSTLEGQIKGALDVYSKAHLMGSWMRGITGIGPVISAGLLAHIYMGVWCSICRSQSEEECAKRQKMARLKLPAHTWEPVRSIPTAGHIWQFAGMAGDNQRPWLKGQKRPFNARLKTLCWHIGQSMMKLSNHPKCYYGHVYRQRKAVEIAGNEALKFADQAKVGATRVGKNTEAYKHYSVGKLPPAHIDARARRYAVKLFLSHMHHEWYVRTFGEPPPNPYPISVLGHAHYIPPPQ